MPKEYAHWTLAEKVYLNLPDRELKFLITGNKSLYELGAVVPDTPSYCIFGRRMREFLSAGRRLHGKNGEDTFAFLSTVCHSYDLRKNTHVWAFLMGVITHLIADGAFHPFIYYFSGSPYCPEPEVSQKSACRHRLVETYLDVHYMQKHFFSHDGKLAAVLKNINWEQTQLFALLSCLFFSRKDYSLPAIRRALRRHKSVQSKFFESRYVNILKVISLIPFVNVDCLLALFYPRKRDIHIPFFLKPFRYRHPVTGEINEESVSGIENRIVSLCHKIFSELEAWRKGQSRKSCLENLHGPSAYTGLYESRFETMTHFNIRDVKRLLFCES